MSSKLDFNSNFIGGLYSTKYALNLRNEIKSALAFLKEFNREVFLLNERLEDDYYSITNGKNPDAIADFKILEIKNIAGGDNALKKALSAAASQSADIIYKHKKGQCSSK